VSRLERKTELTFPLPALFCWTDGVFTVVGASVVIEQNYRFIKKLTRPMKGFKSFPSACDIGRYRIGPHDPQDQFSTKDRSAFQQFAALAAQLCPGYALLRLG
jgi:hypothetical protein